MATNVVGQLDISSNFRDGLVEEDGDLSILVNNAFFDIDGIKGKFTGSVGISITNEATNYVFLNSSGTLVVNTTGYPTTTHVRLARIVATGSFIQKIFDERPFLYANNSSGGGVTDHGNLTGLLDNDHPQYQLTSSLNQTNGYVGLNGTSKISGSFILYGTSSNTACQGNDSRLSDSRNPTGSAGGGLSGSYPNPSVNGMTSGILSNDTAHGNRGGNALHATASVSSNGFMSSTDKSKLDGLPSSAVPTTRTLTAGTGLSGGGDLSANRTFNIDINGLTADNSPDGAADYVATYDASAGTHKKVLLNNLPGGSGSSGSGSAVDFYSTLQTSVGTSGTTVELNTTRKSHADFTLSANEVTCNKNGTYRIDFDISFDDSAAGNRGMDAWLEKNGVEISGTRAELYHENVGQDTSAHGMCIIDLVNTDKIRIRAVGATTITTRANGTRLLIHTLASPGPAGPPGAGSTINIADEGTNIANTPHSRLNFVGAGVTASDGGSGTATITIPGGGSLTSQEVTSETSTTTTTTTDTLMNGMSVTPGAGTYLVMFSTSLEGTSNNSTIFASLYANGVQVTATQRRVFQETSIVPNAMPVATQAVVTVGAGQAIEARWRVSGGTGTAYQRRLTLVKIG